MRTLSLDRERIGLLLLVLITSIGGGLRAWVATRGLIADEIGWVIGGGPAGNWMHGETAVNPPGLRMIIAGLASELSQVPWIGRAWSWLAGTAAIPLMYRLGRSVGRGSVVAGLVAAGLFAVLPLALSQSGLFRSYATLTLVLVWHLVTVHELVDRADGPMPRETGTAFALSALLLPQVHYASVPILFFEGVALVLWLRRLDVLRYYFPAAILFAPLAVRIVTGASEHLAPQTTLASKMADLTAANLGTDVLPMALLATWASLTSLDRRTRIHAVLATAAVGGMALTASYHDARNDLGIVFGIYLIPLLAGLPTLVRGDSPDLRLFRAMAWGAMIAAWLAAVKVPVERVLWPFGPDTSRDLVDDLAGGRWPDDSPTWVYSPESIHPIYFDLKGTPLLHTCKPDPDGVCFAYGRSFIHPFEQKPIEKGYVVLLERDPHDSWFADQCERIRLDENYVTWDCVNGWSPPD